MNRRSALKLGASALLAPAVLRHRYRIFAQSRTTYSERAIRLVRESPVIDMLCQFAHDHPRPQALPLMTEWLRNPRTFTEQHFTKFRDSGMNILALGRGATTYDGLLFFFAQWNGFIASHPDWFFRVDDPSDLTRGVGSGKIGIMLTIQQSDFIEGIQQVEAVHGLGQRVAQLTYNYQNRLGAGFLETSDSGLTAFGHQVMQRMQEVGTAVDVSHCGDRTTLDSLAAAKKPIVFTHASCRALVPGHLRCKTDEMIRKLAQLGGVIGIPFIQFVIRDAPPVTVDHVVDHFQHVAKLVGVEHVGIGSDIDIDGFATAVRPNTVVALRGDEPNFERYRIFPNLTLGDEAVPALKQHRRVFDLTEAFIRRGFSDNEIRMMLGGNWVRVLSALWN